MYTIEQMKTIFAEMDADTLGNAKSLLDKEVEERKEKRMNEFRQEFFNLLNKVMREFPKAKIVAYNVQYGHPRKIPVTESIDLECE